MIKLLTVLFLVCVGLYVQAQVLPSDTIPAIINVQNEDTGTKFSADLRPLRPIAGAPEPFYTYFWEFGDGDFSFEKDPLHAFKSSEPILVRLYATNNYDDGKKPPTRPKPIIPIIKKPMMLAANSQPSLFKMGGSIEMKSNCMPKPGDDMMVVFGYRNKAENGVQNVGGTIAILYNDNQFANNNFVLEESRAYNAEVKTSLKPILDKTLANVKQNNKPVYYASLNNFLPKPEDKVLLSDKVKEFKDSKAWQFKNLTRNEERFLFLHFKTTPEMLKDTNAVVKLTAVFIPDNPLIEREFFTMELPIVASHDPNKMSLSKSRMNYRITGKNRALTYKIRFQNTGKGPAKKVAVGVYISPVFDQQTIEIISTKPIVSPCDSAYSGQSCITTINGSDSVKFVFNNIYLPGMQQDGVNDADSTMGFVQYKIKFKEKPPKLPIKSGAAIVFDKNEPIYTNRAVGRFKMGLSPGIIIGYGFPFKTDNKSYLNSKNFILGGSLAPYSPHKYYWQVELYLNTFNTSSYRVNSPLERRDTVINKIGYKISGKDFIKNTKVITLNAVPLQIRYNINKYVGAGAGTLVSLDVYNKTTDKLDYTLITQSATGVTNENLEVLVNQFEKRFADARVSFFADVQLGLVRVGPSIGFRYIYDPKANNSRLATYATWKF